MQSPKNIGSLIGGAAIVAVSIGLTAGLAPAAAAHQQSPGSTLDIALDSANPGNYLLDIRGMFPMSEGDARDRLNTLGPSGGMDYIVYADDPGENDGLIGSPHGFVGAPGPVGGFVIAVPDGLAFFRQISVPASDLNEDEGTDEVYVKVRFVPGTGAGPLNAYTNEISGTYGEPLSF